jgi:hypothetical protein
MPPGGQAQGPSGGQPMPQSCDMPFQNAQSAALERVPGQVQSSRLHHMTSGNDYYTFVIKDAQGTNQVIKVDAESSEVQSVKKAEQPKKTTHAKGVGGGPKEKKEKCPPGQHPKNEKNEKNENQQNEQK